ncbi:Serine/threonine-protein phosphatase 7 long form-like, partial [Vitis vinifera]
GFVSLDWHLFTVLVERWRPETHAFDMPHGEMSITLQDVAIILGLPVDGLAFIDLTSREGRRGRCRGHVMEQHQHSQTSIAPISEEQIPIENRPSTSYLIDDIEDTNVVFYVPNATDIPIVSAVSIALDVLVAYDVLIASDVLVAINVSIASDVPVASEVQPAYDVPFDVHITFDVHASINVTYQRCPRRKRRALPCGT